MSSSSDIALELVFPASYDVRVVTEIPHQRQSLLEFSRDGRIVDGGVMIEVSPVAGGEWTGIVANASESVPLAHSGVYSTPAEKTLCVVARGDAYFLDTSNPKEWWALEDGPVVAVRSALAERLLLLATPWRVVAVGEGGLAWRTSRIAIDGIALGEVSDGRLAGVADPHDDESQEFLIELRTGYHRGGFPFPG